MAFRGLDERTVLLFYREPSYDRRFPYDRYVRRALRPAYNVVRKDHPTSGFRVWFERLRQALRASGRQVICNDVRLAARHPEHPVGLVGYPVLLDGWDLPNPAILGPALFDHPAQAPHLVEDPRFRRYLVTSRWMYDVFEPVYGDRLGLWHAGIDLRQWPAPPAASKTIDVLIYDKIRWRRDRFEPDLLVPIQRLLAARGLTTQVVRYGQYKPAGYRQLLRQSRSMIFLCEHETQGMAYQEALASDVPILAWDQGFWLDPNRPRYTEAPVRASSVPQFSPECGERFVDFAEFKLRFDAFWQRLADYHPRRFVARDLSLESSAQAYLDHYDAVVRARRREMVVALSRTDRD